LTTTEETLRPKSIRLDADTMEALKLIAQDDERNFNYTLRVACREYAVKRGRMCASCRNVLSDAGKCPTHSRRERKRVAAK
jgi:hypothetical protein